MNDLFENQEETDLEETCGLTCKIKYKDFKEILKSAPPAPRSIPDFESKRIFLESRSLGIFKPVIS